MTDTFISYAREDQDQAKRLVESLQRHQFEVWIDWKEIPISVDWWEEIVRGIQNADNLVFLISSHSLASKVCNEEIGYAIQLNKRIIPIILEEIDIDQVKAIPDDNELKAILATNWNNLSKLNWLFFRSSDDLSAVVQTLIEAIQTDHDYVKTHTRLIVKANEWLASGKRPEFLLRGEDLDDAEEWIISGGQSPPPTNLHQEYVHISRQENTKRRSRTLRFVTIALMLVSVLAITSILFFVQAQEQEQEAISNAQTAVQEGNQRATAQFEAEQERDTLRSVSLADLALEQLQSERPEIAPLLALVGLEHYMYTEEAEFALAQSLSSSTAYRIIRPIPSDPERVRLQSNSQSTNLVAWSPNRLWIASTTTYPDGAIRLWDAATGELQWEVVRPPSDNYNINSISWSPDSRMLATTSRFHGMHLWGATSGELIDEYSFSIHMNQVDWSPDGSKLAVLFRNSETSRLSVSIISVSNGNVLRTLTPYSSNPDGPPNIYKFIWSPDGKYIAGIKGRGRGGGGCADCLTSGQLFIWDAESGESLHDGFETEELLIDIDWNTHTNEILLVDVGGRHFNIPFVDGRIYRQSPTNPIYRAFLTIVNDRTQQVVASDELPNEIAVSPDGQFLAVALHNGNIIIRHQPDGKFVETLMGHTSGVAEVDWSPDGTQLVSGSSDGSLRIWNIQQPSEMQRNLGDVTAFSFSPDGERLAVANSAYIYLLDPERRNILDQIAIEKPHTVYDIAWSPNGEQLVTVGAEIGDADVDNEVMLDLGQRRLYYTNGSIRIWNTVPLELSRSIDAHNVSESGYISIIYEVKWSEDSKYIATASEDGTSRIIDVDTGEYVQVHTYFSADVVYNVEWIPQTDLIAYTTKYDVVATELIIKPMDYNGAGKTVQIGTNQSNWAYLDVSPNGELILTGVDSRELNIISTDDLQQTRTVYHQSEITDVDWSLDGDRFVLSDINGCVSVWTLDSEKIVYRRCGNGESIQQVEWSPNGEYIVALGDQLYMWASWSTSDDLISHAKACCISREFTIDDLAEFDLDTSEEPTELIQNSSPLPEYTPISTLDLWTLIPATETPIIPTVPLILTVTQTHTYTPTPTVDLTQVSATPTNTATPTATDTPTETPRPPSVIEIDPPVGNTSDLFIVTFSEFLPRELISLTYTTAEDNVVLLERNLIADNNGIAEDKISASSVTENIQIIITATGDEGSYAEASFTILAE